MCHTSLELEEVVDLSVELWALGGCITVVTIVSFSCEGVLECLLDEYLSVRSKKRRQDLKWSPIRRLQVDSRLTVLVPRAELPSDNG